MFTRVTGDKQKAHLLFDLCSHSTVQSNCCFMPHFKWKQASLVKNTVHHICVLQLGGKNVNTCIYLMMFDIFTCFYSYIDTVCVFFPNFGHLSLQKNWYALLTVWEYRYQWSLLVLQFCSTCTLTIKGYSIIFYFSKDIIISFLSRQINAITN